ncbi:MAG: stage III sporulation protein AB, partial [Firmicutes bacterium]|nr:stage III sporulation protein AB [Bacillota bacterium]
MGCLVGVYFYKRYKARCQFFVDIVGLIDALMIDVRYKQEGLPSILRDYQTAIKSELLKTISDYLAGRLENTKHTILTKQEMHKVKQFFLSLGRLDSDTQLLVLEGYKQEFVVLCSVAKEKFSKYGGTAIKLGFLLGMGVGILFL